MWVFERGYVDYFLCHDVLLLAYSYLYYVIVFYRKSLKSKFLEIEKLEDVDKLFANYWFSAWMT